MVDPDFALETERRLQAALDARTRAGLPPPVFLPAFRAIVTADFRKELDARQATPVKPVLRPVPAAPKLVARAPIPTKPVPVPPSPVVLAERTRAMALIAMAPAGAEEMLKRAITSGMSPAAFKDQLDLERFVGQVREIAALRR